MGVIISAVIYFRSLAQLMSRFSKARSAHASIGPIVSLFVALLLSFTPFALQAQSNMHPQDEAKYMDTPELDGLEADLYVKEGEVVLPKGYNEDKLIKFTVEGGPKGYVYALDTSSISYGVNNVVRFVLVAESSSGAKNVYYEGMRCDPKQFRIYGYADASGTFQRSAKSEWKSVNYDRWQMREHLAEQVICDYWFQPVEKDQLVERLKGFGSNMLDDEDARGFY